MNSTCGNTLPSLGRRINWQLVSLVGGLAVAISAGAYAGAFERGSSPASRTEAPAATVPGPVSGTAQGTHNPTFILVGSEAEAATVYSALSTDAANDPAVSSQAMPAVVVLETPEQEREFYQMLGLANAELNEIGSSAQVVDLREPPALAATAAAEGPSGAPESIVYIVGSEAEKVALEQQFHEASAHNVENVSRSAVVIDGSRESLTRLNAILGDQMEFGTFEVVDLR